MIWFSNGQALAMDIATQKPDHSKSGCLCPDFKWFLTKWHPFVRISNAHSEPIQNPDHLQPNLFMTIQNPNSDKEKQISDPLFALKVI